MNWMTRLESPGHIVDAISHLNQANEATKAGWTTVEVSRFLFDALNKIQTELSLFESDQSIGEVKAFQSMILKGLDSEGHNIILQSEEIADLVFFKPQIMNHYTLRQHRYRPDQEIEPKLVKKASEEHRKVVTAYNAYRAQKSDEDKKRILERVAELLYIVRSNIAHGEKTPFGPDLKKKIRDENVCEVTIPLQRLILDLLLDYPDRKLFIYGTLAPGKANHKIIADIQGTWEDGNANGRIDEVNGLPFFDWQPGGPFIGAHLFTSNLLPDNWVRLDHFEGSEYKRILVPVTTRNGICIANSYVANRYPETYTWHR